MICQTVRKGYDCPFMSVKGCTYNNGSCHEVVEQCGGCNRQVEYGSGWYCTATPDPMVKWKLGNCNMATHVTSAAATTQAKVNPIKASKRASKKR